MRRRAIRRRAMKRRAMRRRGWGGVDEEVCSLLLPVALPGNLSQIFFNNLFSIVQYFVAPLVIGMREMEECKKDRRDCHSLQQLWLLVKFNTVAPQCFPLSYNILQSPCVFDGCDMLVPPFTALTNNTSTIDPKGTHSWFWFMWSRTCVCAWKKLAINANLWGQHFF